jgi:thioredoxin-like negative regulator of GroEL
MWFPKDINKKVLDIETFSGNNIELSIKYLEYYTKLSNNPIYFYLLAKEYIRLGYVNKARRILDKLPKTFKVLQLKYELLKQQYFKQKSNAKDLREKILKLQEELYLKAKKLEEIEWLEKEALEFNNYNLYLKILEKNYQKSHDLYVAKKLIDVLIADGKFSKALNIIDEVLPKLNNKEKIKYLKRALQITLWSHQYKKAKKYILALLPFARGDLDLIKYLIKTALAINEPRLAKKIVDTLLKGY